ncbi:MAG: recombinase family protein [Lachnospiraceae bacterium]|nr:recombinase family protein [Lachnospiraceae bacterium]
MDKKKRCYIYTRVSTEMQTEGFSLDAQRDKILGYAQYQDIQVIEEFCDM